MGKFSQRSHELELMDFPIENKTEIFQNFKELVFINRFLGGAEHSFKIIEKRLKGASKATVADVGSGAGDFLNYVIRKKEMLPTDLSLVAIDLMPEAHEFAQHRFPKIATQVEWIKRDYREWLSQDIKPDIIHAALFCHHLTDSQLVEFLKSASHEATVAVVINDLQRHPLAYYAILWLTQLFSCSRFTRNDAPLSVLRGFQKSEWHQYLKEAGIRHYHIEWKWAFRYLITIPAHE